MQRRLLSLFLGAAPFTMNCQNEPAPAASARPAYALAIHGGAAVICKSDMSAQKDAAYRAALDSALAVGETILKNGGTVGCVALDGQGNLAAATSTGGMTNKRWNRLGYTPIVGAGTYASNEACAVSCTGHGEFFIRYAVAYDVYAQMIYGGRSLEGATEQIVMKKLMEKGGEGGLIAVDKNGNIVMPFNSEGMFRACVRANGERKIAIYKED